MSALTQAAFKNRFYNINMLGLCMSKKVALICGISGQDGAYLSRLLLNKGYVVHGTAWS